jgi:hypothetical protein
MSSDYHMTDEDTHMASSYDKSSTNSNEFNEGKLKAVSSKHRKDISKCGHSSESYYANGMCKNCYHAKGRTKKADECKHHDRVLYAKGVCKNCYLSDYHK